MRWLSRFSWWPRWLSSWPDEPGHLPIRQTAQFRAKLWLKGRRTDRRNRCGWNARRLRQRGPGATRITHPSNWPAPCHADPGIISPRVDGHAPQRPNQHTREYRNGTRDPIVEQIIHSPAMSANRVPKRLRAQRPASSANACSRPTQVSSVMSRRFFDNHRPFTVAQALVPAASTLVSTLGRRCQSLTETLVHGPRRSSS